MRNPFNFFIELMRQPVWVSYWVLFLMIINFASIGFWSEPLAKVIFATFMASALLMMVIYSRFGFNKILGLGHIFWIPLLIYVVTQIHLMELMFKNYLLILSLSIAISLVIDAIDVWKYFANQKNTKA